MDFSCDFDGDGADSMMEGKEMLLNDNIHGHICLSHKLRKIIDTPEMHRLRDLKQLGFTSYVYPGATHTRFAHSIGVCYLAGTLLRQILARQKEELKHITEQDVFCVEVAGLCHDLGHGPFSHMFEGFVKAKYKKDWKHEQASREMFQRLVDTNELGDILRGNGTGDVEEDDVTFIKELIHPTEGVKKRKGKEFLYEIVNNTRTDIDVDKFDYFARDCHALGLSNMFSHQRFMQFASVRECDDGIWHICHRDKEINNVMIMFQTRFSLHLHAYKHPVVCAFDRMVGDVFDYVDDYMEFQGDNGTVKGLSRCVDDMGAYMLLNDSIVHTIRDLKVDNAGVKAAQGLLRRITKRQVYRFTFSSKYIPGGKKREDIVNEEEEKDIEREIVNHGKNINQEDIYVQIAKFGFGPKRAKLLDNLYLYSKENGGSPKKFTEDMACQQLLPKEFTEQAVRVYSKTDDKAKKDAIKQAAIMWERAARETVTVGSVGEN